MAQSAAAAADEASARPLGSDEKRSFQKESPLASARLDLERALLESQQAFEQQAEIQARAGHQTSEFFCSAMLQEQAALAQALEASSARVPKQPGKTPPPLLPLLKLEVTCAPKAAVAVSPSPQKPSKTSLSALSRQRDGGGLRRAVPRFPLLPMRHAFVRSPGGTASAYPDERRVGHVGSTCSKS